MKYFFLINPNSGKKDISKSLTEKIYNYFEGRQGDYDIRICDSAEKAVVTTREICANSGKVRICACGGDGTLNAVASGAVGFDNVEIGYYPAGSGNDFIKCFGDREDFLEISNFIEAPSHSVDIVKVNDLYCLNLLSVGIDADVNYGIPKFRRLPLCGGSMAYNLSLVECFFKPIGKKLRITLGDAVLNGEYMLIAIGNGRVYGGGYYALPEARYDDGELDVVMINKLPRSKMLPVIGSYKKGEHIKDGDMESSFKSLGNFTRTKTAIIESDTEFVVNIDGEPSVASRLDIRIIPGAIRFISKNKEYKTLV